MSDKSKPRIKFPHNGQAFSHGRASEAEVKRERLQTAEDFDIHVRRRIDGGRTIRKSLDDE